MAISRTPTKSQASAFGFGVLCPTGRRLFADSGLVVDANQCQMVNGTSGRRWCRTAPPFIEAAGPRAACTLRQPQNACRLHAICIRTRTDTRQFGYDAHHMSAFGAPALRWRTAQQPLCVAAQRRVLSVVSEIQVISGRLNEYLHPTWRAGFALAYSNRFAGQLSDVSVRHGLGNVGCFYGGGAAAVTAAALICLFWKFGSLGQVKRSKIPCVGRLLFWRLADLHRLGNHILLDWCLRNEYHRALY